jgi:hypothetical protein
MKRLLLIIACAAVIAATVGAVAIGLSLFTQPEAYAALFEAVNRPTQAPASLA